MNIKQVKGMVFDLDGTVLDSMHVWDRIDVEFLGKRGHKVPKDYIECITAMGFHQAADYTIRRFHLEEDPQDIMKEWHSMAVDAYSFEVGLKPGVKGFIKRAAEKGIAIAAATSGAPSLFEPALKRNGIYEYFQAFVQTREVSRGKEFPDVYLEAARRIKKEPEECMVFEDILKGVTGAKAGGFYTVGVYDSVSAYEKEAIMKQADRYIVDFGELME